MRILTRSINCLFNRSCLLGMAAMLALSPENASAHYDYIPYPPDRARDEGRTEIVVITDSPQPRYEYTTKVELRETFSTQRSPAAFTDRTNAKPIEPDTATLHLALARPPYVAINEMRNGLAFLEITLTKDGITETHTLPEEILEQIIHPNLFHVEAHMYDSPPFVVTIPFAEKKWRERCIDMHKNEKYTGKDPYKEMTITLHENGTFEYEIKTPTLCDDALLGTGKFAPKAE